MSAALTTDPLRAVYDALTSRGCQPDGPTHNFRARCPAHDSDSASLSVGVGADGRALLWCFRGCPPDAIVDALDLAWPDLFPPGHRHARPVRGLAKAVPFIELVLAALGELGIAYRAAREAGMWVAECCPLCRRVDRWPLWIAEDDRGRIALSCAGGCPQVDVLEALTGAES